MDANKLKVLREIEYSIPGCCGSCAEGSFVDGSDWGTCEVYVYSHLKHTGEDRALSVHREGRCDRFERDQRSTTAFGGFAEFLKNG